MSYADAAASGPSQSAEEPPQVLEQDLTPQKLLDVDDDKVTTTFSSYSGETRTQVERVERETEEVAEQIEREIRSDWNKGKKSTERTVKKWSREVNENKDNPVVLGNAVVWTALLGALGYGAYRQHQAGNMNWQVGGVFVGAVGLFAAGDYFLSKYLFKKYPPK